MIQKKAALPPLGLATVAAMLPASWEKKLVDMSIQPLKDNDILWADYVFISAMIVQRESMHATIERCHTLGKKVVAGGPLVSTEPEEFDQIDYLVLDEGEVTLPLFLADLEKGTPKHIYTSQERPVITQTPIPDWSLIKMSKYSSMSIQYSRGCPYDCEFCDIVILNGHKPRTKTKDQVIRELESLGISMDKVTQELEDEGVKSFSDAFTSLLNTIDERRLAALAEMGKAAKETA